MKVIIIKGNEPLLDISEWSGELPRYKDAISLPGAISGHEEILVVAEVRWEILTRNIKGKLMKLPAHSQKVFIYTD